MVQRLEWAACDVHNCHCDIIESEDGDMVNYEDYAALEKKLKALAEAVFLTGYEPVSEATYRLAEDICND